MDTSLTMCERCDGLCCRVYDIFDHETGSLVKKSGDKCGHLDTKNRCRIYATIPKHGGFRDSCKQYDCMEGGPIVTIFARRIPDTHTQKSALISSLLETIRLKIESLPESRETILQYTAELLMRIVIDDTLILSIKVARTKLERFQKNGA